jgi:hypothetical protein
MLTVIAIVVALALAYLAEGDVAKVYDPKEILIHAIDTPEDL